MATIKVKRNSNSRGKCKLAFNKVYTARVNPTYNRSYIIGNNVYLSEYFTIVTDQQPKPKPIVKTDPETGKLKVERNGSTQLDLNIDHSIREPEPFDIREVIAGYIRHHGTQLTAIELIGHLTIDTQWQSTEK